MTTTLGDYLRSLRWQAGLTLRDLETKCGVSNAYLSQLERGRVKAPSPHVLASLAGCYGADYLDLLRRAGYPVPMPDERAVVFVGADRLTEDERAEVQEIIALKLRRRAG